MRGFPLTRLPVAFERWEVRENLAKPFEHLRYISLASPLSTLNYLYHDKERNRKVYRAADSIHRHCYPYRPRHHVVHRDLNKVLGSTIRGHFYGWKKDFPKYQHFQCFRTFFKVAFDVWSQQACIVIICHIEQHTIRLPNRFSQSITNGVFAWYGLQIEQLIHALSLEDEISRSDYFFYHKSWLITKVQRYNFFFNLACENK